MFVETIVIAGYRARADVRSGAHRGVAQIGQMAGLYTGAQSGGLDLDEVADVDVAFQHGTGPQPREGADNAVRPDLAPVQMTERADQRAARDLDAVTEHDVGFDDHIWLKRRVGPQKYRRRV